MILTQNSAAYYSLCYSRTEKQSLQKCYNFVITAWRWAVNRKICAIGNSQGVSIPREMLEKLRLSVGSEVDLKLDEKNDTVVITPVKKKDHPKGINMGFVSQVNDFIDKYRPALKELSKK